MNYWQDIVNFFINNGWRIIAVLAIIILGILAIRITCRILRKIFARNKVDDIVSYFICSVINIILIIILVIAVFDVMKISTAPFVAVLGTVGLALALSMQEGLSNLVSGVVLIITKPFKKGDYISVSGIEGSVTKITMLATQLITFDNKTAVMPNNKVLKSEIINFTNQPLRRIEFKFNIAYGSDIAEIKKVINEVISSHFLILKTPSPEIRLLEQASSSLIFTVRVWVETPNYFPVFFDIQEQTYEAFRKYNIEIPYTKMDVNIKNNK